MTLPLAGSVAVGLLLLVVAVASVKAFFSSSGTRKGPTSAPAQGKVYPVRGEVLCSGQAAAGARVIFQLKGTSPMDVKAVRPSATVQADCSFALSSYEPDDGAPVGDYTVLVVWPKADSSKKVGGQDRLRGRYSSPRLSPLHARVEEKQNQLPPFEVH